MKPWWERWPGRLEFELHALESAGIRYQREDENFKKGIFALKLELTLSGRPLILFAVFPPLYPYFRPEVFAASGTFGRHQNPIGGNLCLLGRKTDNWDTDWSLASLLSNQLPRLAEAATTQDLNARKRIEEPLGEPITCYYPHCPNSIILVDCSQAVGQEYTQGKLCLSVEAEFQPTLRGRVVKIKTQAGKDILTFPGLPWRGHEIPGTWIRLDNPPRIDNPRQFERELIAKHLISPANFSHKVGQWFWDIIGILVAEEIQQTVTGDGWLFLVRGKQEKTQHTKTEFVRAGRCSTSDFTFRVPELSFLTSKSAAVIGLGSIGAPIAIELARSGLGHITLVDFDFVEPGTIVRWPLGFSAVGRQKARSLTLFIGANYPTTKVFPLEYRFGSRSFLETDNSTDDLLSALSSADIIIDATAEHGIHHFLSDYANEIKKPFLYAYATAGGYGGLTACLDPTNQVGCWHCLQSALYEVKSIPEPPFLENGEMQPPGCGERTATFTALDTGEVSLEAARMAISALSDGRKGSYPRMSWDVAVVELRAAGGERILPLWSHYRLPKLCPNCI